MLKSLFVWLDGHPGSYWFIALGPTLLLTAWIGTLVWRELRPRPVPATRAAWTDALVLSLFLLAWRWPFLFVARDFNPDESQQIAGALTLVRDPVFWRSVDGNTSGPLNFYALLPIHWLGAPLDYFTARLAGLVFIGGALFLCLRTLSRFFGRAAAWLGVLPAAAFFATVTNTDLIQYSTEHLPLLVLAAAVALLAGRPPGERWRLWAACFVAGALPLTKLQTAPLGLTCLGWAGWQLWCEPGLTRLRRLGGAALAAALPWLLLLAMVVATGQTEAAVRRFFLHNVSYVGETHTLATAVRDMAEVARADGRFPLLLLTGAAGLLVAGIFFLIRRVRPPALLAVGSWLILVAVLAIFTPRRGYVHYLFLLPVPLTVALGAAWGGWWRQLATARGRGLLAAVLFLAGGLLPVATRCLQPEPDIYREFSYHWSHPRTSAAAVVHALAGRGESLGVWGWANNLYVESPLPQATRDATSLWSILPNPQQAYHRAVYLADLQRHAPAVFVDAVGPGAFAFNDRSTQSHETFPELADYIRGHYTFVTDLVDARIYARNDLAVLASLTPARLDQLISQGRVLHHRFDSVPPTLNSLEHFQRKFVGQQAVIMLLPPARMEWPLDADVRAVTLDFGFDPVAYLQGASNGAEIILELIKAGHTRLVYRRFLDPARVPADRGRQAARVVLPPFGPGTHLVLRSTPGPNDDNAWDWVYLAGLEFHRNAAYLPEQFPGFNRVPDFADAEFSGLTAEDPDSPLQLHAPASFAHLLNRNERRLRFAYGIKSGAYTNGNNTDGAVYRVELQIPGQPDRLLFERFLQPVTKDADRGLQHADVTLPAVPPGARLTVRITPGPAGNAAWDWTYISSLTLQ